MKKKITLLTSNERKKKSFEKSIRGYDIEVEIEKPWIPEIQSEDCSEVASFSAEYGAKLLNKPVVKMDTGFFIEGLKGFPGPLVHYVDKQIGVEKFFEITKSLANKNASIKSSIVYCEPGGKPVVFESGCVGKLADTFPEKSEGFIDCLFIPTHKNNPDGLTMGKLRELDYDKFLEIWGDSEIQMAKWLSRD